MYRVWILLTSPLSVPSELCSRQVLICWQGMKEYCPLWRKCHPLSQFLFYSLGNGGSRTWRDDSDHFFLNTSISSSDLYTCKTQNPPVSEHLYALINLVESVFKTRHPNWIDCQQLLYSLFTSDEREGEGEGEGEGEEDGENAKYSLKTQTNGHLSTFLEYKSRNPNWKMFQSHVLVTF